MLLMITETNRLYTVVMEVYIFLWWVISNENNNNRTSSEPCRKCLLVPSFLRHFEERLDKSYSGIVHQSVDRSQLFDNVIGVPFAYVGTHRGEVWPCWRQFLRVTTDSEYVSAQFHQAVSDCLTDTCNSHSKSINNISQELQSLN